MWTLGGAVSIAVGTWLIFDDVEDFGEGITTYRKPNRRKGIKGGYGYFPIHHYMYGIILLLLGMILVGIGFIKLLALL